MKRRLSLILITVVVFSEIGFAQITKNEKEKEAISEEEISVSKNGPKVNIEIDESNKLELTETKEETEVSTKKPPPKKISQKGAIPGRSGRLIQYDYTNYDSLTSRIQPPDEDNMQRGGIPYVITEQRLKELRAQFMYWYFDQGGNDNAGDYQKSIQNSSPQVHKNLNFQLPFFGFRYNYTRVSMNGYLEFSDPPQHFRHYPLVFPIKDWPKVNDPGFIGIFYSKMRIGATRHEDIDQRKPGVYFRLIRDLQTRIDQFAVEVRERLKWDIREGVIGSETFNPKHAIIVTWKNMSFAGGIDNSLFVTNTFQMVLATDEVYTYCIFNYLDLQWTTHTEAGGDTTKGEGGTPAFIGFNAGNGTQSFEYLPYSQMSTVRDLTGRGFGNGFKGRHIFRIDEKILPGTCNKDIDGANLPLMFAPESGNMLGGTVVNITGPCFKQTDRVTCRFDNEEVIGTVVDSNRAICIQPMYVYAEGYIRFEISIGNGKYNWKGKFFIETPATAAERIYFEDRSVYEKSPGEIKITWEKYNLTANINAPIRISLWGYRETTIRPELQYIDVIDLNVQNSGAYTIVPANYKLRENYLQDDMQFGFIQINLTESTNYNGLEITPVIWSKPIPLGWYFGPQWEKQYGKKWPAALCDNWLRNDRFLKNFANELPQCPCTLQQALNDKGRFLPDFDCDKDLNPKCMYHVGALHCVRSGSPSLEGSEQQCCYDKNSYLMLSYDQQWGSRPFRAHNLGYLPWNEANKVPSLSQWYHDMTPFFTCCFWQEEQSVGCETFRFERRPSQDCVAYQSPGVATVFGDPHIVTFDNLMYTFNGKGEFVLVRTNSKDLRLDVQGRFEQLPDNAYGEVRATQLTSVVAKGNNSATIEVRLRPRDAQWRYRLDVFADGRRVYFDRPALKFQHFPGVTVYTPTYILNQSEVIVMFDTGAGIEVIENKGYMSTRVYLPWNFINKTRGLFGNWSFDILDDFTLPDGGLATVTNNLNDFERIHKEFGIQWMVEDNEDPTSQRGRSLFYREFGRTSSYYTNKTFEPVFKATPDEILPGTNRTIDREKAKLFCGTVYQCQYDYAMSLNRDLAHFTKNYLNSYTAIREEGNKRIVSCGVLETPRFGRKSNFFFTPGTKVAYECNQNFILIGDKRRTCLPDGRWDASEYGYTECLRQVEYESITAGITAGIVLAIILPLLICVAGVAYCIYNNRDKEATSWEFNIPRSRSNSRVRINDPALYSQEASPLESPERVMSPVSDISSASSNRIKRSYDKSYRTNEPLVGKPDIEWEEKDWDISPEGSDFGTFKAPVYNKPRTKRANSDVDYIYEDDGEMSRAETVDSGLGYDKTDPRPQTLYEPTYERIDENLQKMHSASQPILNYTSADYAEAKPKKYQNGISSMSSKITAV